MDFIYVMGMVNIVVKQREAIIYWMMDNCIQNIEEYIYF
jgi:hypothetical protein